MISLSIRRKIMGIAVVLIVLMAVTAFLSMASATQVGDQLDTSRLNRLAADPPPEGWDGSWRLAEKLRPNFERERTSRTPDRIGQTR